MKNEELVSVLGDLTALYAARSRRKPINYEKMKSILLKSVNVEKFEENHWYTLYSDNNEAQASFVKNLRETGWNIVPKNPRDIKRGLNTRDYRFDSHICYQIGLSVNDLDHIIIVSDSFELYDQIKNAQKVDDNIKFTLAFFGENLDGRWHKVLNDPDNSINWIDLDEVLYEDD